MIPTRSKVLRFGAMVPIMTAAAAASLAPPLRAGFVPRAGIVWAGSVLAFLGGVRRGLSFQTPGGPHPRQPAGMARSFGLASTALLSAPPKLAVGFTDIAAADPVMAQMALAAASLLVLAALLPGRGAAVKQKRKQGGR